MQPSVLFVGGPLDGRFMNIAPQIEVIRDADGSGAAYVRSPLSDQVTVFHYKTPVDIFAKKRGKGFPRQK